MSWRALLLAVRFRRDLTVLVTVPFRPRLARHCFCCCSAQPAGRQDVRAGEGGGLRDRVEGGQGPHCEDCQEDSQEGQGQ